jgi:ElaB/YqjD/DUF883 family membrane-anchored ribosome-binding protein
MNDQVNEVNRDKLVADMKTVIVDAEELLKATASAAGDRVVAARAKVEESMKVAKVKIAAAEDAVKDRAKAAARATDDYVHAHPWKAVGTAAAVGVIIGMLIGRR